MPRINKTIYIDTKIEFVCNLNPSQPEIISEGVLAIAHNLFLNGNLVNAATISMAGATIFDVMITTSNKILQVYLYRKEIRSAQKQQT